MNETIKTIQQLRTIHGDFSEKVISEDNLEIILNKEACPLFKYFTVCFIY